MHGYQRPYCRRISGNELTRVLYFQFVPVLNYLHGVTRISAYESRISNIKGTRSQLCACVSFSSVMANNEVVCCLQMSNLFMTNGFMTCPQSVTQYDPPSVDFLLIWHRLTRPFMTSRALVSSTMASFYVFGLRCHCRCYRDNQTSASRAAIICLRTSER